jgi:hypothetical protein
MDLPIKPAGRPTAVKECSYRKHNQKSESTSNKFIPAAYLEHHCHTSHHTSPHLLSPTYPTHINQTNHHKEMSPSRNSSASVPQDDRRDSSSSHRSLNSALRWLAHKITENDQSEQTRRSSYDGIMPSPYESTAAYHARMIANKERSFW